MGVADSVDFCLSEGDYDAYNSAVPTAQQKGRYGSYKQVAPTAQIQV